VHYLPETVMHTKLLTFLKQPLVFVKGALSSYCTLKCALSDLKYGHVIDSEASDSLRVTLVALSLTYAWSNSIVNISCILKITYTNK